MQKTALVVAMCALFAAGTAAQTNPKQKPATPAAAAQGKALPFKDAKLAAIETWLAANKNAADRGDALSEAASLAFELAQWQKAADHAGAYLAEFAAGEQAGDMQLTIGRALLNVPGKEAAAKAAFQKAIERAGDDVNGAVTATMEYADALCNLDDKDGAVKVLEELQERFSKVRGLKEFVKGKLDEMEEIGSDPKPIDVTAFDGKPLKLEALKGKVVLIDFWATSCGPCIQELPNVIAAYKKYHAQGFEIVGISLDDSEDKLKDFLGKHEMPWPQFFDGKGWQNEIGQLYGVQSIPKTYLLDRAGKIRKVGVRGPALAREIEKLLAQKS